MVKLIQSVEELKDWNVYREYSKEHLKKLDGEEPAYITKKKLDFQIDGKPFRGYALVAGKKARMVVQKCKAGGVQFHEGRCTQEAKTLHLRGFPEPKFVKEAAKTFLKLKLGWKVATPAGVDGEEGGGADGNAAAALAQLKKSLAVQIKTAVSGGSPQARSVIEQVKRAGEQERSGDLDGARAALEEVRTLLETGRKDLVQRAAKIEKAVQIWTKTEQVVTGELRKLQKAILAYGDPRGESVARGLEGILQKLDRVDDEAREAAEAAERGDPKGFEVARDDFLKKVQRILDYASTDELIKDADSNPAVSIKIGATLEKSLSALVKAV